MKYITYTEEWDDLYNSVTLEFYYGADLILSQSHSFSAVSDDVYIKIEPLYYMDEYIYQKRETPRPVLKKYKCDFISNEMSNIPGDVQIPIVLEFDMCAFEHTLNEYLVKYSHLLGKNKKHKFTTTQAVFAKSVEVLTDQLGGLRNSVTVIHATVSRNAKDYERFR